MGNSDSKDDQRTICFCHNVTCARIRSAIQAGATTLKQIQDQTKASTGCTGCESEVVEILEEELAASAKLKKTG